MTAGCNVAESKITNTPNANLLDFGDPNVKQFITRLNTVKQRDNQVVTITQFGDSHTAADLFTGEFRHLMQNKYGNAGIGWITPIFVKGQYNMEVKWKSANWELFSSRTNTGLDFPMGGFIAKPTKDNATIQILPNAADNQLWQARLTFKTMSRSYNALSIYDANNQPVNVSYDSKVNQWKTLSTTAKMPLTIKSAKDVELGGIWLTRDKQPGVIVSAIATNGARQSIWQKWDINWFRELAATQSDLVILAYGTNESFDKTLNLEEYRQNLINNIRLIRKTLPNAVILLISPPDTLTNGDVAPPMLQAIKDTQKQIAKSEKTLFWDWQKAMGGKFVIKQWLRQGLARPDLVHQTPQGYKESAKIFYFDLIEFLDKK
ncbi:SGNH/GDSL hydrolase family protein [Orbaceae bacterium ESL0727]|nr:SGNH/GDSL hydrolase family protein [Orbaceae bacterium ESL0727]